jgi:hypothetical protein
VAVVVLGIRQLKLQVAGGIRLQLQVAGGIQLQPQLLEPRPLLRKLQPQPQTQDQEVQMVDARMVIDFIGIVQIAENTISAYFLAQCMKPFIFLLVRPERFSVLQSLFVIMLVRWFVKKRKCLFYSLLKCLFNLIRGKKDFHYSFRKITINMNLL